MKNNLKKVWRWVINSSEDPNKLSLTLKGLLPLVIALSTISGYDLRQDDLSSLTDAVVTALVQFVALVSALTTLYGAGRKVINTTR